MQKRAYHWYATDPTGRKIYKFASKYLRDDFVYDCPGAKAVGSAHARDILKTQWNTFHSQLLEVSKK